jgi:hypothetical protein
MKVAPDAQVLYPQLPSASQIKAMRDKDNETDLKVAADNALMQMQILEKNRETREQLEQEEHSREGSRQTNTELVYPDIDGSVTSSKSDIAKLKQSK